MLYPKLCYNEPCYKEVEVYLKKENKLMLIQLCNQFAVILKAHFTNLCLEDLEIHV